MPVTHPMDSLRDAVVAHCRKHGRGRPEYLEGLDIIQYFPPKGQLFSSCPEDCRGNTVGLDGAQEKSMKREGRGQGTTFEKMT